MRLFEERLRPSRAKSAVRWCTRSRPASSVNPHEDVDMGFASPMATPRCPQCVVQPRYAPALGFHPPDQVGAFGREQLAGRFDMPFDIARDAFEWAVGPRRLAVAPIRSMASSDRVVSLHPTQCAVSPLVGVLSSGARRAPDPRGAVGVAGACSGRRCRRPTGHPDLGNVALVLVLAHSGQHVSGRGLTNRSSACRGQLFV